MSDVTCHPACALGPDVDHPGYLGYRCIDNEGYTLPFPGERPGDCPACLYPLDSAEHHAECVAPLDQVAGGEG